MISSLFCETSQLKKKIKIKNLEKSFPFLGKDQKQTKKKVTKNKTGTERGVGSKNEKNEKKKNEDSVWVCELGFF